MDSLKKKIIKAITSRDTATLSQLKHNLAGEAFLRLHTDEKGNGDIPPEAWMTTLPKVESEFGIKPRNNIKG